MEMHNASNFAGQVKLTHFFLYRGGIVRIYVFNSRWGKMSRNLFQLAPFPFRFILSLFFY